ncbi:acyl-CoA N-acyltransferase [Ampelomyces quisqualis]|uniref:Acyl-CoA N-acyltransferase n=1 Tax=Ampelomyces quisqualis TaxID=50730 RepID=A0A6A5QDK0_AMPQU|nr:acyl-CoA N-acyltransferase [Ampelomyces quisqualis]
MDSAYQEERLERRVLWRKLTLDDIDSLASIANKIHPGLPESNEVFLERVGLFPKGCLALVDRQSNELVGYAISHPISYRQSPALNSLLGTLCQDADQYYIHDLAILPEWQGEGYAKTCIEQILQISKGYETTGLVSVYGTATFWEKFGFKPVETNDVLNAKLSAYGEDAVFLERQNR